MSDKKTKRYASIYGAKSESIRPDQYLVELIIQRRAEKKGIQLPERFWSTGNVQFSYWAKIFGSELRHAKPLFQKYDPDCIIDAFQSFDCRLILSAANKQLDKIAQEFQRRKDLLETTKEVNKVVTVTTNVLPRPSMGKPNKRSKLKND